MGNEIIIVGETPRERGKEYWDVDVRSLLSIFLVLAKKKLSVSLNQ